MGSDEDREQAKRLLKIYKGNLRQLLEQKAKLGGIDIPVALENQIDETRAQIAMYEPLAPTQRTQQSAQNVSSSIDLTAIYIQGTQLAAEQARQADQNRQIIDQQARDSLWRMQTKQVVDELVLQVSASEKERQKNAPFMRRVLVLALAMSILALMVSCAALILARGG